MTATLSQPTVETAEPYTEFTAQDITIREFEERDYPVVCAIQYLSLPEYADSEEEWRTYDRNRAAKYLWKRFVAETPAGKVVAYGSYSQSPWMYHPQRFSVEVTVHPEYRKRGIGTKLYSHITDALAPFNPSTLCAHNREDLTAGMAFIAKYGYEEAMRDWESRLDMPSFDFAPFAGAEDRVAQQGIIVRTMRQLMDENTTDWKRQLYDVDMAISKDMPSSDAPTSPEFEDWCKSTFENPSLLPDAYFIAVDTTDNNRFVGVSVLWKSQTMNDLFTGATGVLREYRRRGIALAMKLNAMRYAKSVNCPTVRTWNAQSNRGMLSINEALGFVKQPAWIEFKKVLKPEEETV